MASSKLQIYNLALVKVGASRVASVSESSTEANVINAVYDLILDEVLSAHPWNFAIKRQELSRNVTTPEFEYTYEYNLPNDCLRVLWTNLIRTPWVIENGKVLTDADSLKIMYIFRQTDVTKYSPNFVNALSARLAVEINPSIGKNATKTRDLFTLYKGDYLPLARSMDAQEGKPRDDENNDENDTFWNERF